MGLGGFIKAVAGGAVKGAEDAASGADKGISAMRDKIASSFSAADNSLPSVRDKAGAALQRISTAPLLGLGAALPAGKAQTIAGFIAPSPSHIVSDVKDYASHPKSWLGIGPNLAMGDTKNAGRGAALLNDTISTVGLAVGGGEAFDAIRGGAEGAKALMAARGISLASDAGTVGKGAAFLRDAGEIARANGMTKEAAEAKIAKGAMEDSMATAARGAKSGAAKIAKQLVDKDTGLVQTAAERAGSGLVRDVAEPTVTHIEQAPAAANENPGLGHNVLEFAKNKAKAAVSATVQAPYKVMRGAAEQAAEAGPKTLGHLRDAVVHPGIRRTPVSLVKAGARGVETAGAAATVYGTVRVARQVRNSSTALGATLRTVTGGNEGQPSNSPVADELATNPEAQRAADIAGLNAVKAKYGDAGLKALVSGLQKAKAGGYEGLIRQAQVPTDAKGRLIADSGGFVSAKAVAKATAAKKARNLLTSSVRDAAKQAALKVA